MAVNIYDAVNEVAKELPQTEEFMGVQNAFAALKNDAVAFDLYEQFTGLQTKLQSSQAAGQQPAEDDMKQLQELAQKMSNMDAITNLMKAEQTLNQLLNDINSIILKPINAIYENK